MTARALYDFQPSADVELELKKGDIVAIRRDVDEGWFEGELNGKRGLFPKSFVTVVNELEEAANQSACAKPKQHPSVGALADSTYPLTPTSSKKVFMETLLTPTHNTAEHIYDAKKAHEIFVADHSKVHIAAGPQWDHRPLLLNISVRDSHKGLRSSGPARQHITFEVSTKELKSKVQRKFKQFLWLYDKLADCFPCISLPPIPIKQSAAGEANVGESRRRGLERFLNRVAKHPVLGSTKILYDFLTAVDDKEWKIGKHHSGGKLGGKNSRKLFSAPIYHIVQYPPYNVPLNQLASIDKFSHFSEVVETNFGAVARSCERLMSVHEDSASCLKSLGRSLQQLSSGSTHLVGSTSATVKSKKASYGGNMAALPGSPQAVSHLTKQSIGIDVDNDSSDDFEGEKVSAWNWREDDKFSMLMSLVYDIGSKVRSTAQFHTSQCSVLEESIVEILDEYSSIIHTLPVLVRLHEEAMATYNESKQKNSKKDAEYVRQDCETLNNILLSEFDYFSESMLDDLQTVLLSLLKSQAEHYQKLATEWQGLHTSFLEKQPGKGDTVSRTFSATNKAGLFSSSCKEGLELCRRASDGDSSPKIPRPPNGSAYHYVNLSSSSPLSAKRRTTDFTEHTYANLPSLSQRSRAPTASTTGNQYENWKPSVGHSPSHKALKDLTPSTHDLPPTDSPIPPPLILRRQERDSDEEIQQDGSEAISPTIPSLPYSQINFGSPLRQPNANEAVQPPDDQSSTAQVDSPDHKPPDSSQSETQSPEATSPERNLSSPVDDSPRRIKKPVPLPRNSSTFVSVKNTPQLTDSSVDSFAENSDQPDTITIPKSSPLSLNSVVEKSTHPVESAPPPPLTKKPSLVNSSQAEPPPPLTKKPSLVNSSQAEPPPRLTKKPSLKNSSQAEPPPPLTKKPSLKNGSAAVSKSLSSQPPPVKMKLKSTRTTTKTSTKPEHDMGSNSPTELMRKLTHRRLQMEKQIKDPKNSNSNNNWTEQHKDPAASGRDSSSSSQSECVVSYQTNWKDDSDDTLAKYGIVEDKSGGSFIV